MSSELTRAKARIASIARKGAELETTIVRKAVLSIAAAGIGYAESKGMDLAYFGVPTSWGSQRCARSARRWCAMQPRAGSSVRPVTPRWRPTRTTPRARARSLPAAASSNHGAFRTVRNAQRWGSAANGCEQRLRAPARGKGRSIHE